MHKDVRVTPIVVLWQREGVEYCKILMKGLIKILFDQIFAICRHISSATTTSNQPAIIEATGFIRNSKGEIELVAFENTALINKRVAECSG